MAYEHTNGHGTAWKNKYYEVGGNKPYAKGQIKTLEGELLDVILWIPKNPKVEGFNITLEQPKERATDDEGKSIIDDLPF